MESLPLELTQQIVGYLDIVDALALAATSRALRVACRRRCDPVAFLQPTFDDPLRLLAAMTDYQCVLAGERALDFFVPGACPAMLFPSWDFYVPCRPDTTLGMMAALSAAGVCWDDPFDTLFNLALQVAADGVDEAPGPTACISVAALRGLRPINVCELHQLHPPAAMRLLGAVCRYLRDHNLLFNTSDDLPILAAFDNPLSDACCSDAGSDDAGSDDAQPDTQPDAQPDEDYNMADPRAMVPFRPEVFFRDYAWLVVRIPPDGVPRIGHAGGPAYIEEDLLVDEEEPFEEFRASVRRFVKGSADDGTHVRLVQCHAPPTRPCPAPAYLADFADASHVQGYIAGWGVYHPLFALLRERLALLWPPVAGTGYDVVERRRKRMVRVYHRVGFRFFRGGRVAADDLTEVDDELMSQVKPLATLTARQRELLDTVRVRQPAGGGDDTVPAGMTLVLRFPALERALVDRAADTTAGPEAVQAVRTLFRQLGRTHAGAKLSWTDKARLTVTWPALPGFPENPSRGILLPVRPTGWISRNDSDTTRKSDGLPPLEALLAPAFGEPEARLSARDRSLEAGFYQGLLEITPVACTTSCGMPTWDEEFEDDSEPEW